jgi:hypothetical protein
MLADSSMPAAAGGSFRGDDASGSTAILTRTSMSRCAICAAVVAAEHSVFECREGGAGGSLGGRVGRMVTALTGAQLSEADEVSISVGAVPYISCFVESLSNTSSYSSLSLWVFPLTIILTPGGDDVMLELFPPPLSVPLSAGSAPLDSSLPADGTMVTSFVAADDGGTLPLLVAALTFGFGFGFGGSRFNDAVESDADRELAVLLLLSLSTGRHVTVSNRRRSSPAGSP